MARQHLAFALQKPISQTIYLARHGDTKFNSDGTGERVRGWLNVPLTAKGKAEAEQAGKKLKGKGIVGMFSSDLRRASETAEIIAKHIGLKPEFSPLLRTWNVGMYEGAACDDCQEFIDQFTQTPDQPIPGGESFNQFKKRIFSGVTDAAQKYFGRTVLIVTHHSVERAVEAWDKAGQPPDHSLDMAVYHEKGDKPGAVEMMRTSVAALKGQNA